MNFSIRATNAALILVVLLVAWSFYRAQRNPNFKFDMFDLIMEQGRVSRIACAFLGTFALTSWVMLRLTIDGKMTEGYFGAYGTMWVAPIIARLFTTTQPSTVSTVTATTTEIKPMPAKEPDDVQRK